MSLKGLIFDKGWFGRPPKNSVLRKDPACAWLSAGTTEIDQRSKHLPALHKDVLRKALKTWIEIHFFIPVAGLTPKDDKHVNMMEYFVAFVWGYYTLHHKPVIPAFTDVGRFIFTYIWRNQHALFRYVSQVHCTSISPRYKHQVMITGCLTRYLRQTL